MIAVLTLLLVIVFAEDVEDWRLLTVFSRVVSLFCRSMIVLADSMPHLSHVPSVFSLHKATVSGTAESNAICIRPPLFAVLNANRAIVSLNDDRGLLVVTPERA